MPVGSYRGDCGHDMAILLSCVWRAMRAKHLQYSWTDFSKGEASRRGQRSACTWLRVGIPRSACYDHTSLLGLVMFLYYHLLLVSSSLINPRLLTPYPQRNASLILP